MKIKPTIKVYDNEGNLTKQYNNAITKMINSIFDIDLEQFDFDKVAKDECKELDDLVTNLCKKSGLGSTDIYSMIWDRFEDEYGVEFEFDRFDETLFESKIGDNKMRKSIREKFDAPKDWDFDEMLEQYGMEYLNDNSNDWEDFIHYMDDLQYYLEDNDLFWLLDRIYYGGQWYNGDYHTKDPFEHNESYFVVNAYGNFYSVSDYHLNDCIKDRIEYKDDGEESFYNWCVEQGYFEIEE